MTNKFGFDSKMIALKEEFKTSKIVHFLPFLGNQSPFYKPSTKQ